MMTFSHLLLLRVLLPLLLPLCTVADSRCTDSGPAIAPCSTCVGRCGEIAPRRSPDNIGSLCSCDAACIVYADCCFDMPAVCPAQHAAGRLTYGLRRPHGAACTWWAFSGKISAGNFFTVRMCPNGTRCVRSRDLTQTTLSIPVTSYYPSPTQGSPAMGVHYINYACAECNYAPQLADSTAAWPVLLQCNTIGVRGDQNLSTLVRAGCRLKAFGVGTSQLPGTQPRVCEQVISSPCSVPGTATPALVKNCTQGIYQSYMFGPTGRVYRNGYCACCQGIPPLTCKPTIEPTTEPTIGSALKPSPELVGGIRPSVLKPSIFQGFSLQVLVNFNDQRPYVDQRNPCKPSELWIPEETACHPVVCPEGFTKSGPDCFPSTLTLNFTTTLIFRDPRDVKGSLRYIERNESQLLSESRNELRKHFQNFNKRTDIERTTLSLDDSSAIAVRMIGGNSISVNVVIKVLFHLKDTQPNVTAFIDRAKSIAPQMLNSLLLKHLDVISLGSIMIPGSGSLSFGAYRSTSKCKWVAYKASEFTRADDGTMRIIATNKTFPIDMYEEVAGSNGTVRICWKYIVHNMYWTLFAAEASDTLGIVTIVLTSLSITCLAIRLCLHSLVPSYRTFAGWLQFHLCLSLCLAFVSLLVSGTASLLLADSYPACLSVAAFMYWMFLVAFAWMFVIAFNTWMAFRPSSAFRRADMQAGIWRYAVCAWLLPLALVGVVVGLDFSRIDPRYRPHLGVKTCWFNETYALLAYFGVPIACCMLLSIIFYILTVITLCGSNSLPDKHATKRSPSKMRIYVGLFVVMGICWVFGFAAAFIQLPPPFDLTLWYIFVVLNSSQGIFIFVFFVCKKRVLHDLKLRSMQKSDKKQIGQLGDSGGTGSKEAATKSTST